MLAPELTIRRAGPEDLDGFTNLVQSSTQGTYVNEEYGIGPEHFDMRYFQTDLFQQRFAEQLSREDGRMAWIAEHSGTIVGAFTSWDRGEHVELLKLHVDSQFRGAHLGSKLMDLCLEYWGNRRFGLDLVHYNRDAHRFYQKYQFGIDLTRGPITYEQYSREQWPAAYHPAFWSYRLWREQVRVQ